MKKILALFMGFAVVLTLGGCAKKEEEPKDYVKMSDDNVVNYYFAANKESEALLNEICTEFNECVEDLNASFGNSKFLADSVTSPAKQTDSLSGQKLGIGFIENGELCRSFANEPSGIFAEISERIMSGIADGENSAEIESIVYKSEAEAVKALENGTVNAVIGVTSTNNQNLIYSSAFCTDRLVYYARFVPASITYLILFTPKQYEMQAKIFTASPTNIRVCDSIEDAVSSFKADEQSAYFGMFSEIIALK